MSHRLCVRNTGLILIILFVIMGNRLVLAEQTSQQADSTGTGQNITSITNAVPKNLIVGRFHLNAFDAAMGNLSICEQDTYCMRRAKEIKSWLCAMDACSKKDASKEPISCFEQLSNYSVKQKVQVSEAMCPAIISKTPETRAALLALAPELTQDDFIESTAYLIAIKESAGACEAYIKNYLGAWGPAWSLDWNRAMSGCRILGKTSTRNQEENDLYSWFNVTNGTSKCSNIVSSEMSQACSTAGAKPF